MYRIFIPWILVLYGFVACGIPLSRIMIGPMPLYFIDILAFLLLLIGFKYIGKIINEHKKISFAVIIFIIAILPTHLLEITRIGFLEPVYILLRTLLHILAALAIAGILRKQKFFTTLILGLTAGLIFTGLITISNSLPITGPWVRATIFKIEVLKPQHDSFYERNKEYVRISQAPQAERGDSLVGISNTTGMVLSTMFPFVFAAFSRIKFSKPIRLMLFFAIPIILGGILLTYSRASYLSLGLLLISYVYLERKVFANRLLPIVLIGTIGVGMIGIQSDLFKFDFVIEKFDLSSKEYAGTNKARILSYTRPWKLLSEDPMYFVRGAGRTDKKLRDKSESKQASILTLKDSEMHSVFAASVFYRGFLAMLAMHLIYFQLIIISWRMAKYGRRKKSQLAWLPTAALISMVALLPGWLTDHYIVSAMNAHMHFFLLVSLIITSHYYFKKSIVQHKAHIQS